MARRISSSISLFSTLNIIKNRRSGLTFPTSSSSSSSFSTQKQADAPLLGRRCLFVGEANRTYTLEMIRQRRVIPEEVYSTVFESKEVAFKTYKEAKLTAGELKKEGVQLHYNVDATSFATHPIIGQKIFNHIQFNYPHHISADPTNFEPHQDLITGFFEQAKMVLDTHGIVRVLLHTTYPYGAGGNEGDAEIDGGNALVVGGKAEADGGNALVVGGKAETDGGNALVVGGKAETDGGNAGIDGGNALCNGGDVSQGWDLKKLAKDAGFTFLKHTDFDMSKHKLYKPKKGFGKNPNAEFKTAKSRYYDFKIDWGNPINPKIQTKEDGLLLLQKYDKKQNK